MLDQTHKHHVLLVDDHRLLRQALAHFLNSTTEFEVVAQVGSLAEARRAVHDVDIAIIDLSLPDGDGTELLKDLHAARPRSLALVITMSTNPLDYARAVEAGAAGILHKTVSLEETLAGLRRLVAGQWLLSPPEVLDLLRLSQRERERSRRAEATLAQLTPREREVLGLLAQGLSNREIAKQLSVTEDTERTHMVNIMAKLDVHSRLQALVVAARHGVVAIGQPVA